jgi:hypothetical protein
VDIVDLPDGSITLAPNPVRVRALRVTFGVSAVLAFAAGAGAVILSGMNQQAPWPVWIIAVAFFVGSEWFVLSAITPPRLKADAKQVSSIALLATQRMPRTDLRQIFRGQALRKGRYRSHWEKSYLFATSDGKVGMTFPATAFAEDGIAEFSQRLDVPIRGDFSVQVKDRVDPATA